MAVLFTRTTSTGVTLSAEYGRDNLNAPALVISLDGKRSVVAAPVSIPPAMRSKIPAAYVAIVSNHQKTIPLTATEVAAFEAARASDPAYARMCLVEERRELVLTHNAIADEIDARRAKMWDRHDEIAPLTSPELDAARAAIANFDAAHPEIKAELEAERAASVKRNQWM